MGGGGGGGKLDGQPEDGLRESGYGRTEAAGGAWVEARGGMETVLYNVKKVSPVLTNTTDNHAVTSLTSTVYAHSSLQRGNLPAFDMNCIMS